MEGSVSTGRIGRGVVTANPWSVAKTCPRELRLRETREDTGRRLVWGRTEDRVETGDSGGDLHVLAFDAHASSFRDRVALGMGYL